MSSRPIIVSIPHASTVIPPEIADTVALSPEQILRFTDLYTDRIFTIPDVYIVQAEHSRIFVDVNRAPDDIVRASEESEEVVSVLTTWDGLSVYTEPPSQSLADQLIKKYHDPYHQKIEQYMPDARFLFDCHSLLPFGPKLKPDSGEPRPDINIGNINYSTCTREHTIFVRDFFQERGFLVGINTPYAGKYILGHHCHRRRIPPFLVPGMLIEINQKLYLQPDSVEPDEEKLGKMHMLFVELIDSFSKKFCPIDA